MSTQEQLIQRVSNDLNLDLFSSICKAADYYHVSKSTVAHRRTECNSTANVNCRSQRLLNEEEKVLIQYIQDLQRQNQYSNYSQIRQIITKLLKNKDDQKSLGKHYITRLISRYLQLKAAKSRYIDVKRLSALNSAIIEHFFDEFKHLHSEYAVETQNIYNMNETGF